MPESPLISLPDPQTRFVGREQEIVQLRARLEDPACRLLTLVGTGGMGKTRLALEVARGLDFADGVHFIGLQPLQEVEDIVPETAGLLGLQLNTSDDSQQQLEHFLADKQLLLILDNFEDLIGAVGILSSLLGSSPKLKLLVTSREALNLQVEHLWPLTGLDIPGDGSHDDPEHFSAVRLLVERIQRVKPDFVPDQHRPALVRICQLVEGMPLALELAASWARALDVQTIAEQIGASLDFLSSSRPDLPARHQSLRAVFDHSYHLLSENQQQVFTRLSLFRGGCTLQAAQALARATPATLAALIDKSLLRLEANGRYDLHEQVRQYAQERLESSSRVDTLHEAHSVYFAAFLEEQEEVLYDDRLPQAVHEIQADFENVRLAWRHAVTHQRADLIEQGVNVLYHFGNLRSRNWEVVDLLEQARAAFPESSRVWGKIVTRQTMLMMAMLTYPQLQARYSDFKQGLDQARAIALRDNDEAEIALGLMERARLEEMLNHFETGLDFLEQYLERTADSGDTAELADALSRKWFFTLNLGRGEAGHPLLMKCVALAHSTGRADLLCGMITILSWNRLYDDGDPQAARQSAEEALETAQQIDFTRGTALDLYLLGIIALLAGDLEEALIKSEQLQQVERSNRLTNTSAFSRTLLGVIRSFQGDFHGGLALCQEGRQLLMHKPVQIFAANRGITLAACGLEEPELLSEYLGANLRNSLRLRFKGYQLLCLPCAAFHLTWQDRPADAVEILAFMTTQADALMAWSRQWPPLTQLRAELENTLGPAAFDDAWARGKTLALPQIMQRLAREFDVPQAPPAQANDLLPEPLTPRELEVLNLLAQRRTNREIADALVIGVGTVKTHVHKICAKLNVPNRRQAARRAQELHLL